METEGNGVESKRLVDKIWNLEGTNDLKIVISDHDQNSLFQFVVVRRTSNKKLKTYSKNSRLQESV